MKKEFNIVGGVKGEFNATKYLEKKNYKILEQNHRNKLGEIDIIAQQKDMIVFIEVKSRSTLRYGRPSEVVDFKKQRKLRNVANLYLLQHGKMDCQCRFDVIEVVADSEINHIENAF